jgi:ubiquinone/menaquinone biosynthesis C-methylase UbiE
VDYREIHLAKGDSYDATIASRPLDAYMARREEAILRGVVPRLGLGERRYLDFACGTGRITSIVAPLVRASTGVDISESMLAGARQKCPRTRFVCVDLTQASAELGPFDLATSFRFFGNAEPRVRDAVLRALARVVRPGGCLIVNNHRNPDAIGARLLRAGGHDEGMDLTNVAFASMLREHGFEVTEARSIGVWLVRSRMRRDEALLAGQFAQWADRALGGRAFARWAPNCVFVARRRD